MQFLGKPLAFKCPVDGCVYYDNPIFAEKSQIRAHIIFKHDYKQWQKSAFKHKLIPSMMYRSRGFFINLLCDFGITRGSSQ